MNRSIINIDSFNQILNVQLFTFLLDNLKAQPSHLGIEEKYISQTVGNGGPDHISPLPRAERRWSFATAAMLHPTFQGGLKCGRVIGAKSRGI